MNYCNLPGFGVLISFWHLSNEDFSLDSLEDSLKLIDIEQLWRHRKLNDLNVVADQRIEALGVSLNSSGTPPSYHPFIDRFSGKN